MSLYTYESRNPGNALETYEWDNVWWEQTNRNDQSRVLYIGDSISCGMRRIATSSSKETMLFDGFGTSKAIDNPFFFDSIRIFARQQGYRDAVLFNNGLHGWHLDDGVEYGKYYEQMVKSLLEEFRDTPLVIVLTTSVANPEREQRVKRRNEAAVKIAEKYGLPVIDLYSVSVKFSELRSDDGVHFSVSGYEKLAEQIVLDLKSILLH
jgi:hypothetical protein